MSAGGLRRRQFRLAHGLLLVAARGGDLAAFGHAVWCEDVSVHGVLGASPGPLALTSWAGRTGLSELPPVAGVDWRVWARRVRVDVPEVRRYAGAVFAATDTFLARLPSPPAGDAGPMLDALLVTLVARATGPVGARA